MKTLLSLLAVFALLLEASASDVSCKGCGAGKLMLQCDYYVARQGDLTKQDVCIEYAKIVDIDGASAKAAWYYLLGGKPDKAFDAAMKALNQGQTYAAGYVAQSLVALGNREEAENYLKKFQDAVQQRDYFVKEVETLRKIYPNADFSVLLQ